MTGERNPFQWCEDEKAAQALIPAPALPKAPPKGAYGRKPIPLTGEGYERRKRPVSHKDRTLRYFQKLGWSVEWVEYMNSFTGRKCDKFGYLDAIATRSDHVDAWGKLLQLGIQATSSTNKASHLRKINAKPHARKWLGAGNRIVLILWDKNPKTGHYDPTLLEVDRELLDEVNRRALKRALKRARRTT